LLSKITTRFSNLEFQVLSLLWQQGELTAKQLLEQISAPVPAYSTLTQTLRLMGNKDFLRHNKIEGKYYYFANIERSQILINEIQSFSNYLFSGNFHQTIQDLEQVLNDLKHSEETA
jgi:BlaI family penicillinase repressor